MKFIDEATIHIQSGHGGPGCVSFRREKFVPHGGPDGGDGGQGADIIFVANPRLSTLIDFRYKRLYRAQAGGAGEGQKRHGANSPAIEISVPLGTVIRDRHTGELLADLTHHPQRYVALKGGRGGKGNFFFRSPTRQIPQFAQLGEAGQERDISLELKLLADVGLIGFPNAGKSTLISRLSNARPKIADYPFTTLIPQLGVVRVTEEKSFVVADMPGLIEGAHKGLGLGIQFLKHIERTRLFLHLIDISESDSFQRFEIINDELAKYNPKLLSKDQIVVLTKTDLISDDQKLKTIRNTFKKKGHAAHLISAVQGQGIEQLIYDISGRLNHDSSIS